MARHCAFLLGPGKWDGDDGAPPLSVEQTLALIKELMPAKEELPENLIALEETRAPLGDWPDLDSALGARVVACAVIFLEPSKAAPWLRSLLRLFGPTRYEQLMLFLAFVRIAHFWSEVHPDPAFESDLESMLREEVALAEPLLRSADEVAREVTRWEPGLRLYEGTESESQRNIEAIRHGEARFRAIFENAAIGIARVAPDGHWLEVNQRLCDIFGYSREELMTKTFVDITYSDDLEPDMKNVRRLLAGEIGNYSMEKRFYRKDGSVVWANLTVSLARKADGEPDYFISFIEDISAKKKPKKSCSSTSSVCGWRRESPGWASSSGTRKPTAPFGRTSGCTKSSATLAPMARSARRC